MNDDWAPYEAAFLTQCERCGRYYYKWPCRCIRQLEVDKRARLRERWRIAHQRWYWARALEWFFLDPKPPITFKDFVNYRTKGGT